ncbi:flotillin-1-like isoform X2 [Tubulanus polymorphus]|uniref:flotillin-1-like isoform X2 n=1 Tax=Tubulanus polymorphus TaxID=672921 RepID=UPI003DA1E595
MGFKTCGPNEAMVISGCCYRRPSIIPGGRAFLWPCIQRLQRISLNTMTLSIESTHVYTQLGVPVNVMGVAQVKISSTNSEMLHAACQQFLGKSEKEIRQIAKETLEGHQRAIMAHMTVEEIYQDRKKFSQAVFEVASSDLINMGISVVSYTLRDISDSGGYLKALGMSRTAQVQKDARMGEAEALRDSGIKEALAKEAQMAAEYSNKTMIAEAQRDFELKKAAYDMDVETKKAQAELSYSLQAAKTKQRIKEEAMQIKVVERGQQIALQEQEIMRRERELDATINKPAEAEKFKMEKLAEAQKLKVVLEAEADSQAIQMKGEAEAYAIEAKARAEAEQMAKKADAWKDYQDAAMVDMILEMLPKMAAEVAAPLSACNKITMVSSGNSDVGAAKLTGEVMEVIEKMPKLIKNLTSVDIHKSMKAAMRNT